MTQGLKWAARRNQEFKVPTRVSATAGLRRHMSYLVKILECTKHNLDHLRPFVVGNHRIGWIKHSFVDYLRPWPNVFQISDASVVLSPKLKSVTQRTSALDGMVRSLIAAGVISHWHGERRAASKRLTDAPLFVIDRCAAPYFGIRIYDQHVNGIVCDKQRMRLWVAKRSKTKWNYPGKLDNFVAGAVGFGRDFALFLSKEFRPICRDGEVDKFFLLPIETVAKKVKTTNEFKSNCNLVIIHFLIRHGFITPYDPDYEQLIVSLHMPTPRL